MHVAVGGVVHVTPVQGLPTQEPAVQPKAQVSVLAVYEQLPIEQAPGAAYEVRTAPLHVDGGGALHETPLQGSGRHAPPLQPNGQAVSTGA